MERKLGKPTDQRMAMIKNQASELLWYGQIKTTVDRAKEVRRYAEKLLTLAINSYEDEVLVTKTVKNIKGEKVEEEMKNDGPRRLAARRKMMASLIDIQETKNEKESKSVYRERTKDIKHPLIEKIFNEYAPKYAERNKSQNQGGGYTRIIKLGARRGDNAEMALVELV
ncbi:MAG: bL17 family ribosomal protein [Christensenellales bacterium]|jgi:large subunit ribosomal protein L17